MRARNFTNTPGGTSHGGAYNNGTITLGPGSYGALSGGGGWDLNFSSGEYRFDSIHFGNATNINLDLSGGPIRILVTGELFFGSQADVSLTNGGDASMIYWETHLADDLNAFRAQGGSDWRGTVYAPYGGIHFGSGSGPTTFQGHFWSGWDGERRTAGPSTSSMASRAPCLSQRRLFPNPALSCCLAPA